jgi:hypothetical protein
MKRWLGFVAMIAAATAVRAAEENFTHAVRAEDFSAAGLSKLSPDELARLDTLVRDYKSGALAAAKREAEAAARARVAAEARAAQAEARAEAAAKPEASLENAKAATNPTLLAKARVMLAPGTKVEYETVESRIKGDFRGWSANTVFELENGSRWKIQNPDSYYMPAAASPKVTITPASFGGFWMKIEGVSSRVRVMPLGGN